MSDKPIVLPCPFCGKAPTISPHKIPGYSTLVVCDTENCPPSKLWVEVDDWNRRSSIPLVELESLEAEMKKEARIEAMEAELTAERERRIAAEDIVDRSLAHFPEKKLRALAHGYRLKYPKGDEHG